MLTQIENLYPDEDNSNHKQGRLWMANYLSNALHKYISNDCPLVQDKFGHTKEMTTTPIASPCADGLQRNVELEIAQGV